MEAMALLGRLTILITMRPGNHKVRKCTKSLKFRHAIGRVLRASCSSQSQNDGHGKATPKISKLSSPDENSTKIFSSESDSANPNVFITSKVKIPEDYLDMVNVFSPEKVVVAAHLTKTPTAEAMVTGIKTADWLLKGIKAAHGVILLLQADGGNVVALGSPDGILLGIKAAKVVIKGVKMSQKALKSRGVKSLGFGGKFKDMMNGMKASWGALDVVRGAKVIFSAVFSGRLATSNWNLVVKAYETSRGAVNTVEALTSLRLGFFTKGFLGIKGAISGIGVMIKAWVVSKEIIFLIKGLGFSHGARQVLKYIHEIRQPYTHEEETSKRTEQEQVQVQVETCLKSEYVHFGKDRHIVRELQGTLHLNRINEARKHRFLEKDREMWISFHNVANRCSGSSDLVLLLSVQGLAHIQL